MANEKEIIKIYDQYYSPKLAEFGSTFKGVDWGTKDSQEISFEQLVKVIRKDDLDTGLFSLLDYGCGYGGLVDYFKKQGITCDYTGYDILRIMLKHARQLHQNSKVNWIDEIGNVQFFDYVLASGVFSLKMECAEQEWEQYVIEKINQLNSISKKGFSFNCLTSYSDKHLMKDYLYYANPNTFFDYCKRHFSKHVALLHDYPKYEFTIIVRK